jgi:(2Fe-2S) ferredoxin
MGFIFNEERRVAARGATKSPLGHHQKIRKLFTIVRGFSFAKSLLFPILTPMQTINVKVCTGRSCTERQSNYIKTRLDADREFYGYSEDEVIVETCMCQGRCKEGPTVVFGADVQIWQNPVKASELLRKKVTEARKRIKRDQG